MSAASAPEEWVSLQEAGERLHMHADTLRHWADSGRIRSFRTPGGHRRFNGADIEALVARRSPELGLLLEASVGRARLAAAGGRLASEPWYARFDEGTKAKQRELGHDLMRLLVAHAGDPERKDVESIQRLGARYAELAQGVGLSLGDAMRAFHLFAGVVRSPGADHAGSGHLDSEIGWFLNEVRIAMVESYGA